MPATVVGDHVFEQERGSTEMRKILVLATATAALAGLVPSQASALTHAQQDRLLAQLKAKMACVVRYPVTQFTDITWYDDTANTPTYLEASGNPDSFVDRGPVTGLDYDYFFQTDPSVPPDTWLLGIKNTSGCRSKFPVAANPHPVAPLAQLKARALARRGL
jgi:hypothetical protein